MLAKLAKLFRQVTQVCVCVLQKQPAKRRSSTAAKAGGARGSRAAAAVTLATPAGTMASAAGTSKQDWRTAKVQKAESAVPIGKQLKVSLQAIASWLSCPVSVSAKFTCNLCVKSSSIPCCALNHKACFTIHAAHWFANLHATSSLHTTPLS